MVLGLISMFSLTWASLIKSHCRISRGHDSNQFRHIVFKSNILKSRFNMRFKGECQSCTTTAHPLQSTLKSTGASSLPSFFILFFSPCIFRTAGLCLSHTRLPKITGDGSYKLNIGVSLLWFIWSFVFQKKKKRIYTEKKQVNWCKVLFFKIACNVTEVMQKSYLLLCSAWHQNFKKRSYCCALLRSYLPYRLSF